MKKKDPTDRHGHPPFLRDQHQGNMGEIVYRDRHPADPLRDEATKLQTHRGGLGDARTEHY